ncbi:MAG: type 1 glutamine amidotransferase [Candidatus Saccharimonadales bacterium]
MKTQRRPVIGVTPAFDNGVKLPAATQTLYVRREYTQALATAGAVVIILNPDMPLEEIAQFCDGVVVSGGEDIPPQVYAGKSLGTTQEPLERVEWEKRLLEVCEQQNMPVLGVCYGMQLIALQYGGSLYQDIATEVRGSIEHVRTTHVVEVKQDFLGLKTNERLRVASRHHQAVHVLPKGFSASVVAPDGVIEAMQGKNCYGVQWHPESDESGQTIYQNFVNLCL